MQKFICKKCKGALESKKALRNHLKNYHSKTAIRKRLKAAKKKSKNPERPFYSPIINVGLPESNRSKH